MNDTILVVDDDPIIRESISELLDLEGYHIQTATNGLEALQMLERGMTPCVVLLDMRMPVMDGWGFARALKERGLHLPVVVMSAAQSARSWAAEIHADGFVAKPFGADELLRSVGKACLCPTS